MFTGKKILDYDINRENKIETERDDYILINKHLNRFNRMKLSKINKLIDKIVSLIKMESYWEYTSGEFTYKSDFTYDSKLHDIVFSINSVKNENNEYVCTNGTKREKAFLKKYEDALKKLASLEKKKKELSDIARVMPIDKTIYFNKRAKQLPVNKEKKYNSLMEFMSNMAENFVNDYGEEIIGVLIKTLNKIDNYESPFIVYEEISKSKLPENYKRSLLTWISTYSNPGKDFLNTYYDEHYYGPAHYNKPNYEDIMTNNMIKLHL